MHCYRITKYNPKYRNSSGAYLKDGWTSISDIGTIYNGKKSTLKEYFKIEEAYVKAILLLWNF